jgi:ArsR family transcriptional regulator
MDRACRCLKGVAHPVRLAVLLELRKGPASVGQLEGRLGKVSQSNLSQHLAKMQACGIVKSSRDGAQVFYEVADERVFDFIDLIGTIFCKL